MGMCSTEEASECCLKKQRPLQSSSYQGKNISLFICEIDRGSVTLFNNDTEFLTLHQLFNC